MRVVGEDIDIDIAGAIVEGRAGAALAVSLAKRARLLVLTLATILAVGTQITIIGLRPRPAIIAHAVASVRARVVTAAAALRESRKARDAAALFGWERHEATTARGPSVAIRNGRWCCW